jgi:hypothetical protein
MSHHPQRRNGNSNTFSLLYITRYDGEEDNAALSAGLQNLVDGPYEKDFCFIVGQTPHYCPSFIADFLSPKIARDRKSDCTIDHYSVSAPDAQGSFGNLLRLGFGFEEDVSDLESMLPVALELENSELLSDILDQCQTLTIENVGEICRLKVRHSLRCDREISFIASHFCDCEKSIGKLDDHVVGKILCDSELRLKNEDWLCELVMERCRIHRESFSLFEFVLFEFVSESMLKEFCSFADDFVDYFTVSVWRQLCNRLTLSVPKPIVLGSRYGSLLLGFTKGKPLEGIIAYLTGKCGGNVHDRGVVNVTVSSLKDGSSTNAARNAVDLESDSFFYSRDQEGQWICYDFGKMRVMPTHYSLKSNTHGDGSDWRCLCSWVIEGSADGNTWFELDRKSDNTELHAKSSVGTWQMMTSKLSRFVRLRQTAANKGGGHYMIVPAFELFGELFEAFFTSGQ